MQIEFGRWVFVPHLVLTLMVILLLPLLLSLSYWQWQRAHEKQSMLDAFAISQTQNPVALVITPLNQIKPYQAIVVTGTFAQTPTLLLDNQIHEGRAGFDILGFFKIEDSEKEVLINLGWVPRNTERQNLPVLPPLPSGKMTLKGYAYFPSDRSLVLGINLERMADHKILIQKIDFEQMNRLADEASLAHPASKLLPVVLLADPDLNYPLVRDWQPPTTISPATHYGYAVQWLLLACTLCILYLIFCCKRKPHA